MSGTLRRGTLRRGGAPVAPREGTIPGAGETVLGRFRVVDASLGGGMCVVRLCRDEQTGDEVALKTPRSLDDTARFVAEAEFWTTLPRHRNIATAHALVWDGERPYLVIDAVGRPGARSWGDHLATHSAVPPLVCLSMLVDVAEAMTFLNRGQPVVHLDLKPANLLFDGERTLVADFGTTAGVAIVGGTYATAGGATPAYAAPEVLDDRPVGPSADIWSLGVLLYEMLTGLDFYPFPVDGPDGERRIRDHLDQPDAVYRLWERLAALAESGGAGPVAWTADFLDELGEALDAAQRDELRARDEAALVHVARIAMGCIARDPHDRWPDFRTVRSNLRALFGVGGAGDDAGVAPERDVGDLWRRVRILCALERPCEAVALLSHMLELRPDDETAWDLCERLLRDNGSFDEADATHARRPIPGSPLVLLADEVQT